MAEVPRPEIAQTPTPGFEVEVRHSEQVQVFLDGRPISAITVPNSVSAVDDLNTLRRSDRDLLVDRAIVAVTTEHTIRQGLGVLAGSVFSLMGATATAGFGNEVLSSSSNTERVGWAIGTLLTSTVTFFSGRHVYRSIRGKTDSAANYSAIIDQLGELKPKAGSTPAAADSD